MHLRFRVLLACAFLVAFVNCGDITLVETEKPPMPDTYTEVAVARRALYARWTGAQGETGTTVHEVTPTDPVSLAPYPTAVIPAELVGFFRCVIQHESATSGVYAAVNPSGKYRGAYQADRDFFLSYADPAWHHLADPPAWEHAPAEVQDAMALAGYMAWRRGERGNPWSSPSGPICEEYAP